MLFKGKACYLTEVVLVDKWSAMQQMCLFTGSNQVADFRVRWKYGNKYLFQTK